MNSHSPATILALLAEMARCLRQEMSKATPTAIDPGFSGSVNSQAAAQPSHFFECLKRCAVKSRNCTVFFLVLSALLITPVSQFQASAQGKKSTHQRGGQAGAHMSPKGSANGNPQWSADPTRGWIRAEERHEVRKAGVPSKNNTDKGKAKVKAKAKGY